MKHFLGEYKSAGIYVHVPFCRSKCSYCSFYSGNFPPALRSSFVKCVLAELGERQDEISGRKITTLYLGGGTPSLLSETEINMLSSELIRLAEKSGTAAEELEFTIEANPEDVNPRSAVMWRDAGINRVSLGVQSFIDVELKACRRGHDAAQAMKAAETIAGIFGNFSIDLIFGLPYQTERSLLQSVDAAVSTGVNHLSAYSLTFDERTLLTTLRDIGKIEETAEDISVGMFRLLSDRLEDAGFEQYEISNYSRPGYRSRHNSGYWSGSSYLGLGPAAHSYDGGIMRRANHASLKDYIGRFSTMNTIETDRSPFYLEERLDLEQLREEMLLTRMRTSDGLDLRCYESRFGLSALKRLIRQAGPHISRGLIHADARCLRLTREGIMLADDIILDLAM